MDGRRGVLRGPGPFGDLGDEGDVGEEAANNGDELGCCLSDARRTSLGGESAASSDGSIDDEDDAMLLSQSNGDTGGSLGSIVGMTGDGVGSGSLSFAGCSALLFESKRLRFQNEGRREMAAPGRGGVTPTGKSGRLRLPARNKWRYQ